MVINHCWFTFNALLILPTHQQPGGEATNNIEQKGFSSTNIIIIVVISLLFCYRSMTGCINVSVYVVVEIYLNKIRKKNHIYFIVQ